MKVSKAIKKVVALGVGAAMMGATILGATAAADLKNYPDFFLDNGTFNGYVVVGAGGPDSLAAVDIASNMYYAASDAATTTTTVSGDAWKVGTSAKFIEVSNSNASDSSISGETIRDITTFIGDEELKALGDGTFSADSADYTYQQFLFFDDVTTTSSIVKYTENDDDETALHFYVKNGQNIGRYKLEFTSVASSDVTDSAGSASTTGTYLDDFDNHDISMFGKTYSVVQARRVTTTGNDVKLVLMAGSTKATLDEGESATLNVGSTEYDVTLTYVDDDEAVFSVKGQQTNKLKVGDTFVLSDKSEIGVSQILYQNYAGGKHQATFYLGAQKMELKDSVISNTVADTDLKIGSEDIDGARVIITGTDNNSTLTISTIEVNMTAQDDYFVGENEKLSDVIKAAGDEKELLFGNAFDIEYKGLSAEETREIGLKTSSARRYKLDLFDGDGNKVSIPIAYAEAQYNISMGEDSQVGARNNQKRLILNESESNATWAINKDDYFVITAGTPSAGSAKSYLLQYKGADAQSDTTPKIKFKNTGSGETLSYSVTSLTSTGTTATLKIGGYSFIVQNASSQASDDFSVQVSLNGDTDVVDPGLITFVDFYGSQWTFTDMTTNQMNRSGIAVPGAAGNQTFVTVQRTVPNANDYDDWVPATMTLNITGAAGPEVRASQIGLTLLTPDGETEVSYGYTTMGDFIKYTNPSSDPNEMTITYPKKQRLPQLYVTSGATTTSTTTSGSKTTSVKVPVTATKLHTEVADTSAQNVITVGGPCANSVTADVMYTKQGKAAPENCAEGFEPGKAVIALYDVGSKVAMVVAGYTGDDTRRAGKVLAQHNLAGFTDKLTGKQVTVEGTTLTDNIVVTKVE